jgi:hypothetical protein
MWLRPSPSYCSWPTISWHFCSNDAPFVVFVLCAACEGVAKAMRENTSTIVLIIRLQVWFRATGVGPRNAEFNPWSECWFCEIFVTLAEGCIMWQLPRIRLDNDRQDNDTHSVKLLVCSYARSVLMGVSIALPARELR